MSETTFFEQKTPIMGEIALEASAISSINIMAAALFCQNPIALFNLPNVEIVKRAYDIFSSIGVHLTWSNEHSIVIDSNTTTSNILNGDPRVVLLALPFVLEKFGKATLPDCSVVEYLERYPDLTYVLEKFGVKHVSDSTGCVFTVEPLLEKEINLKSLDYLGTILALLLTIVRKDISITFVNLLSDPEVSDLLKFLTAMGVRVISNEDNKLVISGYEFTYLTKYTLVSDLNLIVFFSLATLLTGGNLLLNNVLREHLTSFLNFLTKTGAFYDLYADQLKVWVGNRSMQPVDLQIGNYPNLMSDWLPMLCVYLSSIPSTSTIKSAKIEDTRFVRDFTTLGMQIEAVDNTLTINGVSSLRTGRIYINNVFDGLGSLLAALSSDAKIELVNISILDTYFENIIEKINNLRLT